VHKPGEYLGLRRGRHNDHSGKLYSSGQFRRGIQLEPPMQLNRHVI
jgi:hypothetical protein